MDHYVAEHPSERERRDQQRSMSMTSNDASFGRPRSPSPTSRRGSWGGPSRGLQRVFLARSHVPSLLSWAKRSHFTSHLAQ
jgi:hypothetical protein